MAKSRNKDDDALLERAVAVGSFAFRDNKGRIILLVTKNVARLSLPDRKRLREMSDASDADFRAHGGRIVETPNPANLIGGGGKFYFMKPLTDAQIEDLIRICRYADAQERIEELKRHAELREVAEKLAMAIPTEEGHLNADFRAVIPSDPFWSDLAHAEMLAVAYDAAPRVIRDRKRQAGTRGGGKHAGLAAKARAANWHADCADKAREMLKQGRAPRELAGILAVRFDKTSRQVRTALQAAGVLHAKKRK